LLGPRSASPRGAELQLQPSHPSQLDLILIEVDGLVIDLAQRAGDLTAIVEEQTDSGPWLGFAQGCSEAAHREPLFVFDVGWVGLNAKAILAFRDCTQHSRSVATCPQEH
jgi:hypothetical protein